MVFSVDIVTPEIVQDISAHVGASGSQVENTLKLFSDDCTIPFIARYRKEATGNLDEVKIRDIRERFEYLISLNERKDSILRSIDEQGKMTPELRNRILSCKIKTELEDLYLPFKPKKRTRGQVARERGLEESALSILSENSPSDFQGFLASLVGSHAELTSVDLVRDGIRDYIAECVAETAEVRGELRQWTLDNAHFVSKVKEEFADKKTKYSNYYDYREPVNTVAAHRLMALRRGEKENVVRLGVECDATAATDLVSRHVLRSKMSDDVKRFLCECVEDCYKRILAPAIETELRLETKSKAEEEAIRVFAQNMRKLLLLPPIPRTVVLGVDPGIRTGSKLVVVDTTGKLLEHTTIFPSHDAEPTSDRNKNSLEKLLDLVRRHQVSYVSVGNGTAGREMEHFVEKVLETDASLKVKLVVVNESGASIYSASDVAREEFPDLDITYRGAVSIARRLQDPLAEFVKIDPKSIGVGQYQHDVNQGRLKRCLEDVVESCVNYVGVNINTASPSLLSYVSGIGPSLARNIVKYRDERGSYESRAQLLEVTGFGEKTFQQSAGFLRIPGASNPLDGSGVHPESYSLVEKMAAELGVEVRDLVGNRELLSTLKLDKFVTDAVGLLTLQDIVKEMQKPGRDPRADGVKHNYSKNLRAFEQLQEGQIVTGTVTNVTNFGAFVDIGVHQDGLIHISELCNGFVKNPTDAIGVGDQVQVKVIGVDKERKRISLSRRALEEAATARPSVKKESLETAEQKNHPKRPVQQERKNQEPTKPRRAGAERARTSRKAETEPPASLNDLLSKFNTNRL